MSEFGVQEDGSFRRKHVDDLQESIKNGLKRRAGEDIDLEQGSPAKQIVDMLSDELAEQWEVEEENYYTTYYKDAFGEQLDKLISLAGFSRIRRRVATGEVVFSTSSANLTDTVIPEGQEVATPETETRPLITFQTTESATLDSGETSVTVPIRAQEPWESDIDEEWLGVETNVSSNSVTSIVNPISGIDSVSNPVAVGDNESDFVVGRDRETDAELKLRYENSLAEGGVSTVEAIESNVYNSDKGIVSVTVEEVRDEDIGYGPEVTVLAPGVSDDVIAQSVFDSRAGGLESFGDDVGVAERTDGRTVEERFNRATRSTVHVDVSLTTSDTFPTDGEESIVNRIIRYIGGVATDEINYPGLEIGESVIYDQIFRRVMETQGVIEADMSIGLDPANLSSSNIAIDVLEAATTGVDEVSVNE